MKNNSDIISAELVSATEYAIKCHEQTNHKYDGGPYAYHLKMVYEFADKYSNLLEDSRVETALCAAWCHDVIEDCRQTYNDVKEHCGVAVADAVYALTNEKGKTRKDRANEKYYEGIRQNTVALFVKVCDRLANSKYSMDSKSRMADMYAKEFYEFKDTLYMTRFDPMWRELEEILFLNNH